MGRLILKMSMSLDGFVAGPAGEIDWMFASSDDKGAAWVVETLHEADLHIMGSRTFADMAAWWPASAEPFAAPMNAVPKAVFSRSGTWDTTTALKAAEAARAARGESAQPVSDKTAASWREPYIAHGELGAELAGLKQRYRTVLAHGGASFARALVASGTIDEYRLVVHPVALGRGQALFSGLAAPLSLALVAAETFPSGAAALVYRPV